MGRSRAQRHTNPPDTAALAPPAADVPPSTNPIPTRGQRLLAAVVLALLAGYLAWFYVQDLPSLPQRLDEQRAWRRSDFLPLLLVPDEIARQWVGEHGDIALLDRLPVLAVAGVEFAAALALGSWLLAALRLDRGLTRLERLCFAAGLGLACVSTYTLLVGLAGSLQQRWLFRAPAVMLLVGAAIMLLYKRLGQSMPHERLPAGMTGDWIATRRRAVAADGLPGAAHEPGPLVLPQAWWLLLALPLLVVLVLGAVLPPVEFDVREYHLQAPKEFWQRGAVEVLPHNVYANMPLGTEMLTLAAMAAWGDWWWGGLAGKLVTASFAVLTAIALVTAGERFQARSTGRLAALLYLSTPWVLRVSTAGLVDGAYACYLLLAVYAALLAGQAGAPFWRRALLAGLMAGAATAVKYPALPFLVLPLAVWLGVQSMRRREAMGARRAVGAAVAAATIVASALLFAGPWLLKNLLATGNPLYPLIGGLLGNPYWSAAQIARWNAAHAPAGFSLAQVATSLLLLAGRSEWHAPLLVPLAALALVVRPRPRWLLQLTCYVALYLVLWWLTTHRIDRFWIPVLPLVALLAASGGESLARCSGRWVVRVMVVGQVASALLFATVRMPENLNAFFAPLEQLRSSSLRLEPWHAAIARLDEPGAILLVGPAAVYDVEPAPILYSTAFDNSPLELLATAPELAQDATAALPPRPGETEVPTDLLHARLFERGITHLLVDWGEIARYRSPGNYGYTDFVTPERLARYVAEGLLSAPQRITGTIELYAVRPLDEP